VMETKTFMSNRMQFRIDAFEIFLTFLLTINENVINDLVSFIGLVCY
jgi:hypothetical protein